MACFFDHPYYIWNKRAMRLIGIWPEQSIFARILIPAFICGNVISMILVEYLYMRNAWPDLDVFLEWLAPLCILSMASTPLLLASFNRDKFQALLDHISSDWKHLSESPNVEVLHEYGARGGSITRRYYRWMYSACTCYLAMPLTIPKVLDYVVPLNASRPNVYLFNAYYGVDSEDYYPFVIFHMIWESWVAIITMISCEAMFFTYVEHGCGLFKVVEVNLQRLCNQPGNIEETDKGRSFKILSHCINLHREAIGYTELIESAYTGSLLVLLGCSLLAMSVTELQILMHLDEPGQLIRFGSFTLTQVVRLYFNIVPGQKIVDHSISIFHCAYAVDWHNLTPKVQRLLILIMIRSLRPCQITAGTVYAVTMENYSSIMQTSMSFFTVLSSVR
uniref:Odorant receptor n=1 Tax=Campoletis chlorideae TaxID=219166 RepID=A0A346D424_9HYME|nr:odorant receptor [Campoletis chlorideae]